MNNLKIYPLTMQNKLDKKITFASKYNTNSFSNPGIYMKSNQKYISVYQCYILIIGLFLTMPLFAQDTKFTVVLDAGHGGHDPGAMGSMSREKDINLAITLDLGELIEQKFKDVKVVYSRKTDKYLTLQERADVVNDHHADLFICVHTNSSPSSSAYGAESFTLGLAKTKANLDVAMRENSVITLEEDYKTKYQGFDPKSVDSYIMFEFMQDKYIDRSVEFASTIQKQFSHYCNRTDRGVRQAGFWVLHRSACPSVLVEVGFISNSAEERYLTSNQGQKEMAAGIFNAFVDYKRGHDKKSGRQVSTVSKIEQSPRQEEVLKAQNKPENQDTTQPDQKTKALAQPSTISQVQNNVQPVIEEKNKEVNTIKNSETVTTKDNNPTVPVFKIQIIASVKSLKPNAPDFKGLKDIDSFIEGRVNKYTVGAETDYSKIVKTRSEISSKFPQAFIIAFIDNKKISVKEALKLNK